MSAKSVQILFEILEAKQRWCVIFCSIKIYPIRYISYFWNCVLIAQLKNDKLKIQRIESTFKISRSSILQILLAHLEVSCQL